MPSLGICSSIKPNRLAGVLLNSGLNLSGAQSMRRMGVSRPLCKLQDEKRRNEGELIRI